MFDNDYDAWMNNEPINELKALSLDVCYWHRKSDATVMDDWSSLRTLRDVSPGIDFFKLQPLTNIVEWI